MMKESLLDSFPVLEKTLWSSETVTFICMQVLTMQNDVPLQHKIYRCNCNKRFQVQVFIIKVVFKFVYCFENDFKLENF